LVPVLCGRRIGYECWVFQYWSWWMDNGFRYGNWSSSLESEDGLDVLVAEREVMVSGAGLAMERQWRLWWSWALPGGNCWWGGWVWFSGFFGLNPRAPLLVSVAVYLFPLWRENVGLVRMISGLNPRDWRFGYGQVFWDRGGGIVGF
jgi:hypothetical protein